jgi:hypothetical protein
MALAFKITQKRISEMGTVNPAHKIKRHAQNVTMLCNRQALGFELIHVDNQSQGDLFLDAGCPQDAKSPCLNQPPA